MCTYVTSMDLRLCQVATLIRGKYIGTYLHPTQAAVRVENLL